MSREAAEVELERLRRSIKRLQAWVVVLGLFVVLLVLFEIPQDTTGLLLIGVAILAFLAIWTLEKYGIGQTGTDNDSD